jgi:hypothetical protein
MKAGLFVKFFFFDAEQVQLLVFSYIFVEVLDLLQTNAEVNFDQVLDPFFFKVVNIHVKTFLVVVVGVVLRLHVPQLVLLDI